MADKSNSAVANPAWVKQAQEAKIKTEAEKAAAAKAAFEATFKAVDKTREKQTVVSDSDSEETEDLENKPIGPVDPSKCTAAGSGIGGGTACAPTTFVVVTKDADGRKVPYGGAQIKVKVSPGMGVGGSDQEGIVKDVGDGTYTVTYAVQKRGNYMVNVECNGKPIMGSPFPVFFSAGTSTGGLLGLAPPSTFPNLVNQTMPNMPNYSGSVSGAFPGLVGMIPGAVSGSSGGIILPGIGASFGEICREYLNGLCPKTDCKLTHPPQNLLMAAVTATNSMGTLSQAPMPPSAAAMAAAQAIVALQAWNAHAAQAQAQIQSAKESAGSPEKAGKDDSVKKTLQVSNLSPLLTVEQLKQLFSLYGTIRECFITDSKHFAYIEYSKPEEATAALALNNMDIGGRPLNVEMAKSLPQKLLNSSLASSSSPSMVEQHTIVMQQQFQQALLMQQTMITQMAANKAAAVKSKADLAAARAAEISKKLSVDGVGNEEKETKNKSRSPSPSRRRSKSKSKSPINYKRRQRSRSYSPRPRHTRERRSKSPFRYHYSRYEIERSYRGRDSKERGGRRDSDRSHDHHSSFSRRNRSRSMSPSRRTYRDDSLSPRHRESPPHKTKKSSHTRSKSPSHHKRSRPSPRNDDECKERHRRRRSKSKSIEDKVSDKRDGSSERKLKHRERRRSRSLSEDKLYRSTRTTPRTRKSDSRSKHKRQSLSRSPEGKHRSSDKLDESRRSKYHEKRSRSKSKELDQQLAERTEKSREKRSKHHHRRRSRSKSMESKSHRKETEGGETKYKKSEKLDAEHSKLTSLEAKSPMASTSLNEDSDDDSLNNKRHSGTKSTEKRFSNDTDNGDEKLRHHGNTRLTPMSEELED